MNTSTAIREVQIYRSRGTIIREGSVHLTKGANTIEIAGMSTSALTDTVRMKFPSFVKASSYRVIEGNTGEKTNDVSRRIHRVESKIEALKTQAEMWKSNAAFTALKDMTVKEMEAYIKAYPWRIEEIENRIQDLMDEKNKLEKELNRTVDEERRPLVRAELYSEQDADCTFELSYQDNMTSWIPKYELHTDGQSGNAEFRIKADIAQNTGENWLGTRITLRTGNPTCISSAPKLNQVWVDFIKSQSPAPRFFYYDDSDSMPLNTLDDTFRDTANYSFEPLRMDNADINSEETTTEYNLPARYSISSGYGNMISVDLCGFNVKCDYVRRAYPEYNNAVYLFADIREDDIPVSMNGALDVYMKDIYTANVQLEHDPANEIISIPLGVAEKVSISRSERKKKSSEALIRNRQSCVYEINISAANMSDSDLKLEVYDRIPVSRDQAIGVEILKCDSAEISEKDGKLRWNLNLKSQEVTALRVEYRVLWPKEKEIDMFKEKTPAPLPVIHPFKDDWI